jgi:putative nucleotide binding protein
VVPVQKDDYVHILDFLPKGKSEMPPHKRRPVAQSVGENYFSLLEISPKEGVSLAQGERVYIGDGSRDRIDHIERRIKYDWLTPTAKAEMPEILKSIVLAREAQYVDFYNTAGTISTRQHKLECLPKIGKRHRQDILVEREIEPFKSFDDLRKRVKSIPDPLKTIVDKIVEELKGESKYYMFTQITDLKEKL